MRHGDWGLDSTSKTGKGRSPAVAIPSEEYSYLVVLTVFHLPARYALVCRHISTRGSGTHTRIRVPPESGHGDVSFWYAT